MCNFTKTVHLTGPLASFKTVWRITMTDKNEFIGKLEAQIAEWKSEMQTLQGKAEGATEEVKAQCNEAIAALRNQCEAGEVKLAEWKDKAEDAWEDLQDEAEKTFANFKSAAADSIDRIKSFFA